MVNPITEDDIRKVLKGYMGEEWKPPKGETITLKEIAEDQCLMCKIRRMIERSVFSW